MCLTTDRLRRQSSEVEVRSRWEGHLELDPDQPPKKLHPTYSTNRRMGGFSFARAQRKGPRGWGEKREGGSNRQNRQKQHRAPFHSLSCAGVSAVTRVWACVLRDPRNWMRGLLAAWMPADSTQNMKSCVCWYLWEVPRCQPQSQQPASFASPHSSVARLVYLCVVFWRKGY